MLEFSKSGKFREDLYYRLNVFPIEVPALNKRGNDIVLIAQEMINRFSKKLNKPTIHLNDTDASYLKSYHWPGNVRELQNLIERAVIVSKNGSINWQSIIPNQQPNVQVIDEVKQNRILTSRELTALEKENILKALKQTRWKISGKFGAAELLQIPPTTLASKMKVLGIERPI